MMFYLCDALPLSQSEEIAIRAQVRAASTLAQDSDGSTAWLADCKEDVAFRGRYEDYCKRYLVLCSIAPRMARVNLVMTHLSAHLPDLTQNDRWFLRMHLFCLPCGACKEEGPLGTYERDPGALVALGGGTWEGLKAYLEAQIVS